MQFLDQLHDQPADIFVDRLGSTDRLGEGAADLDRLGGADRIDWFRDAAEHLVEPPANLRTETKRQRRARHVGQFADRLEAKRAQIADNLSRKAQQRYRQLFDGADGLT